MYHIFFIHSSVDGHLGCFHVLSQPYFSSPFPVVCWAPGSCCPDHSLPPLPPSPVPLCRHKDWRLMHPWPHLCTSASSHPSHLSLYSVRHVLLQNWFTPVSPCPPFLTARACSLFIFSLSFSSGPSPSHMDRASHFGIVFTWPLHLSTPFLSLPHRTLDYWSMPVASIPYIYFLLNLKSTCVSFLLLELPFLFLLPVSFTLVYISCCLLPPTSLADHLLFWLLLPILTPFFPLKAQASMPFLSHHTLPLRPPLCSWLQWPLLCQRLPDLIPGSSLSPQVQLPSFRRTFLLSTQSSCVSFGEHEQFPLMGTLVGVFCSYVTSFPGLFGDFSRLRIWGEHFPCSTQTLTTQLPTLSWRRMRKMDSRATESPSLWGKALKLVSWTSLEVLECLSFIYIPVLTLFSSIFTLLEVSKNNVWWFISLG